MLWQLRCRYSTLESDKKLTTCDKGLHPLTCKNQRLSFTAGTLYMIINYRWINLMFYTLHDISYPRGLTIPMLIQVNMDMKDSMGPGKLVRHRQNLSYTYDTYLGPSILYVIGRSLSYSAPSYPSSPALLKSLSNAQERKDFSKPSKPCHVGTH